MGKYKKLIELEDLIKSIIDSPTCYESKHHELFYVNMIIKELYSVDEEVVNSYTPIVATNKSEVLHLYNHVTNYIDSKLQVPTDCEF